MTMSEEWKRQRNSCLQILRSLGYGKHTTENKIQEEAKFLTNIFKILDKKPFDPVTTLMTSVSNVACSLLYGERFQHEDKEFRFLLENAQEVLRLFFTETEGDYIWFYKFKPSYRQMLKDFERCCKALSDFNQTKIEERRVRVDKGEVEEPQDFIEGYLKELKPNSKGERKITENWLFGTLNDLFIAGADTTATTLAWALLLMADRQDIQEKVNTLQWRHNGRDGTSLTIVYSTVYSGADQSKTSKLRVTGHCARNSPVTGEFPAQMASNAENVSIWWRHHDIKPSWHGMACLITGPFVRGILPMALVMPSLMWLCFHFEQAVEQTVELPVIWIAMTFTWRHCLSKT